ncbi:MAG TPA: WbuC family cupin fold metalloprotein [Burkholderiales bacterium]
MDIKRVEAKEIAALALQAAASPRRRINLDLHEARDDAVQRLLNDLEPGTYLRPHRHWDKWELLVHLQGAAAVLTFDPAGRVEERIELGAERVRVVEIPPGTWHTLVALAPGTVLFEVKRGPYEPEAPAEFAFWAPCEGDSAAEAFERLLRTAEPGTRVAPGGTAPRGLQS